MKRRIATGFLLIVCIVLTGLTPGLASNDQYNYCTNPYLSEWVDAYNYFINAYGEDADANGQPNNADDSFLIATSLMLYADSDIVTNQNGVRMVHGAKTNAGSPYVLGMGTCLDDEEMWYVTFTIYDTADPEEEIILRLISLYAATYAGLDLGDTDEEVQENTDYLLSMLLDEKDSIAISYNGFVLVSKRINSAYLFGIDTQKFYDEYYKGSIENYVAF